MISLILTYYNQDKMLQKHLSLWQSYSNEVKRHFHFIIVDDCSIKKAIHVINEARQTNNYFFESLNVSLYEIKQDIYCNIPGAMNLGAKVATSKWLLHMDMDHYFDEENMEKIINLCMVEQNVDRIFKFNRDIRGDIQMLRKNPSGFKFHPKLCLITRECYWNIGGFDEDFCGHYGRTDTAFFNRGKGKFATSYLENVFLCMDNDGDAPGIDRKNMTHNTNLLNTKIENNSWSDNVLRFNWEKINLSPSQNKRIAFISSLFVSDTFKQPDIPANFSKMKGFDYLLFTNISKDNFHTSTSWDIRDIEFNETTNSIVKSRIPKFQPWKIEDLKNYDIIIYCDAYWSPKYDVITWDKVIKQVINSEVGIVQSKNPYRDCAYEECDELVTERKDSKDRMMKTKKYLQKNMLPKKWGLWRNTFLCVNMKNKNAKNLFDAFWQIYENNDYTHRDQPLYSLASFQTGIIPEEICTKKMDHNLFEITGNKGMHVYVN